ncbi:MAG: hypothetical protein B7Z80_25410 [Rhodospirillales bacterium 20-64-7]|nr:MAG: hypothetical protein B7Z80_25410 [Rhodospirillales bacterium 20-64-7]
MAAVLFAHCRAPRHWREDEQTLLRDLAERSWNAIERARAETALRQANTRLQELLETRTADHDRLWRLSRDLLLTVGTDGVILAANPAWEDVLGWTETELIGRKLLGLVHPEDHATTRDHAAGLLRGECLARFENRYRHKDGSYRCITWTAMPGDGVIVGIGRDDTQIRAQAARAEAAQARMRAIFETSYQYLWLLSPEGKLLDANPASLAGIRVNLAAVAGQRYCETQWFSATPGMVERLCEAVDQAAAGASLRRQLSLNLPDGLRHFEFSLRPVRDSSGRVTSITTEAVELTEWRATEEKLRQAQKMEAVGQLTGGLAHDFNNLLTGISGSLDMLKLRISQQRTAEAERYISAAQTSASRAAALTHRLLAFSRRQTLDPHPTDANQMIAGMEDLIRRTIGPQVGFQTRLRQGLWPIFCDANQLENAVLNLCLNARDAMPDGGRLLIETDNVVIEPREARARDMQPGPYTGIFVTDTGIGMSEEVASRAFDPFFTTKPIGMGTGLGLSMIFGFTQQSGGQVRIHSMPGHGTTMRIFLPRYQPDAPLAPASAEIIARSRSERAETVLVVDDEPTVRMLVTEVLDELGYAWIEAEDGMSGLKLLQSPARIDLLITDVGLPGGLNGRQMADAARAQRPELKVMFITGYAETAVIGNGSLGPGMQVVTKPFTLDALAKHIQGLMAV